MEKDIYGALLEFHKKILEPEFSAIKEKQNEHDGRLLEVIDHFDSLFVRLGRLEDEYLMILNSIKRIEDSLENGKAKRTDLEKKVNGIKEQVGKLQSRLEALEKQLAQA